MGCTKVFRAAPAIALALTFASCNNRHTAANEIAGASACEECSLQIQSVVTLGADDSVAAAGAQFPASVIRLENGEYVAGPTYDPGRVAVFDRTGKLSHVIGRYGRGPGEAKDVRGVTRWFGDSLGVFHDGNEISIYDSTHTYRRLVSLASASFGTNDIRATGNAILARRTSTGGGNDTNLREFSADGVAQRGFGASTSLGAGRVYSDMLQRGDTIWAAVWSRYEFDRFRRANGEEIGTIVRTVDWFPPDAPRNEWGGRPSVERMVEFKPDVLLVLIRRPRADYHLKNTVKSAGDAPIRAGPMMEAADMQKQYEQVLELLDIKNMKSIARLVIKDRWLGGFLDNDEVFGYDEDETGGSARIKVWRVVLTGAEGVK